MAKINLKDVPHPSLSRLLKVHRLLEQYEQEKVVSISSAAIGKRLGVKADSIRKDVSYLGEIGNYGGGYDVLRLKEHINEKLGLSRKRKLCVVGLGRLGSAILNYDDFQERGLMVVAGFDSNINKLETAKSTVELFPAHEITDVVRRKAIEIGVIAVPEKAAQECADRLMEGGVKGIINFSPVTIKLKEGVLVRTIDLLGEVAFLSTLLAVKDEV